MRILVSTTNVAELAAAITEALAEVQLEGRAVVSRRQLHQMLLYTAWFAQLAPANSGDPLWIGAHNAVLHFVLPALTPDDLMTVLDTLDTPDPPPEDTLASVLHRRVALLKRVDESGVGRVLDFWDRLS